ncbi:phosphodiester glycosidase family protein [Pseudooceanicola nitratireducens]|uniref:phosphodiester glycosidase family protein n=1 Tax=Pseudooceanicola nitratireducens TaxID=517719 RepID=UPI001C963C63|nr:phosphodiester glycosidase family protein [Pseudooceanicola nitratireducens]MBY6157645.1 phosphodiester glycosidase family protein [Pseudooceanicola nitratireducens]
MLRAPLVAALLIGWALPAAAVDCDRTEYEGRSYTICQVDAGQEDLALFLNDAGGAPYGSFKAVREALAQDGRDLAFAMNAGMYHEDRSPVGLYRENGEEARAVVSNPGPGNFGMLPNGVFCFGPGRAEVIETLAFNARPEGDCPNATQSGPMLVIDGDLHPRFLVDSTSRYIRNGVGTSEDGTTAWFAMSDLPVTFHEFGSLFRDRLGVRQALYFDGNVSRLYAPQIGRSDLGVRMGPIVGVVVPASE